MVMAVDGLEYWDKLTRLHEGCLMWLHYSKNGLLVNKMEELRSYFTGVKDVARVLVSRSELRRVLGDVEIEKIVDKILNGVAKEEEVKILEGILDKVESYLLTRYYLEMLKSLSKIVWVYDEGFVGFRETSRGVLVYQLAKGDYEILRTYKNSL